VRRIVRDMGGEMVVLRKRDKAAYHAFATMVCPLLLSLLACAEEAAGLAGISRQQARRRVLPIIRQTLWNYSELGLAKSFTGPIVRGDARTIRLHLDALAKTTAARDAYIALAKSAVKYLPSKNRQQLEAMLRRSNS
jgi:predicted short-subunit dehydrogenase-like oxidoreductase (DUF2520 family)